MRDNKIKNTKLRKIIMIFPIYLIFTVLFEVILGFGFKDQWDKVVENVNKGHD